MKTLPYSVVDVFAERPLEGNPLAVFHDGRSLSDEDMQAIARETNLSETTFVLPGDDPAEDRETGVRVRIFTTQEELPFAGHPTLGTASWLHLHHAPVRAETALTLRLKGGPIRVQFGAGSRGEGVYATMRQNDPVFGATHDPAEIANIVGLSTQHLLPGFAPQTVSTGNAFCIVPLRSTEVLSELAIPQARALPWLRERAIRWFYCIAPVKTADPTSGEWRARMQWSSGEDPATGSAAGPCIAWLVKNGLARSGEDATILQGVEMRRPSRIVAQATVTSSQVHNVLISGRTIPVATGSFFLR